MMRTTPYIYSLLCLMLWAAPLHALPIVAVDTLAQWLAGAKVSTAAVQRHGIDKCFTAEPVPTSVWQQMQGRTYKAGCPVPKADLRYLKLLHCDMQGRTTLGEMVCHRRIAQKLLHIFRRLYEARYPIACMRLADCYEADDERSMRANNTSAFNYRRVAGTRTVSKHGYGLAVDVNPLFNPCVRTRQGRQVVQPATAERYARRQEKFVGKIDHQDLCYSLFREAGFVWGGDWRSVKDYQHFEYP